MRAPVGRESGSGPEDPRNDNRLKSAMRARGWRKVVLVAVVANQILTAAFSSISQQIDPDLTMMPMLVFSCATGVLVGYWLRVDARNAWRHAKEQGYVGSSKPGNGDDLLSVAENCPKRWLVVLHIELNPDLVEAI
ncbi:hypothetical protein WJ95_13505 [Burkholderia ubonensis]|uniref:hypothetical protein n=1 Tax=Burkholderia ubonensis TaxID=101571 RepID=UPI00075AD32F|nr:hypothetical protein [Burkholderia ubonensis]KVP89010.1 hypothetical protein WJ95_13505 [Burkholderia ubonensis]